MPGSNATRGLACLALPLLAGGCTLGSMGAWVMEEADEGYPFSESTLLGEADIDPDGPAVGHLVHRHGFAMDWLTRDEDAGWLRVGQGSASLYSTDENRYLANQAFGVSLRKDPEGEGLLLAFGPTGNTYEDGEYSDDYPPTGGGLRCTREAKRLDCREVVFVRPGPDALKPGDDYDPTQAEAGGTDSGGDTGTPPPEPGMWEIDCRFAPRIRCPFPEVLERDMEADCTLGSTGVPVHGRITSASGPEGGRVNVRFEGDTPSRDIDGSFNGSNLVGEMDSGLSEPERLDHYAGRCGGEYDDGDTEWDLLGHATMTWRPPE